MLPLGLVFFVQFYLIKYSLKHLWCGEGTYPYRRGLCENDNEIYDVEEQKRDVRERDAGKIKNAYQRCIVSRRNEGCYTFLGMASYYISITMLRPHTEVIF